MNKNEVMQRFRKLVEKIDEIPPEILDGLNPIVGHANSANYLLTTIKVQIMKDFDISEVDWNYYFENDDRMN